MKRKILAAIAAATLAFAGVGASAFSASAEEVPVETPVEAAAFSQPVENTEPERLAICHSGSGVNWTFISPDASGYNGHQHHDADIYGLTEAECLAKTVVEEPTVFQPYVAEGLWLLPPTWDRAVTPTYQAAIFPQDRLALGSAIPCDRWGQHDFYGIDNAVEEATYNSLGDVLTQGEDSSIYSSHEFVYGGDCVEEPPVTNTVCEVIGSGTHSTDLVDIWGNVDTRSKGHVEYVNDGLHVWTEDSTSQSKVSEGIAVNFPLSQTGQLAIDVTAQPGNVYPYGPGLNLLVDITGDLVPDGTLVYETVYGQDLWVTNGSAQALKDASVHTGGNGSENHGTINHFLLTFPDATVVGLAYSLGSGVHGDWVINSITANCVEHTFDIVDRPELPTPEPVLTFGEWTEGEPTCDDPETEGDESVVVQTRTRWSTITPFKLIVLAGLYQIVPDTELAVTTQLTDEERTLNHEGECPIAEEPPTEEEPTPTPVPAVPSGDLAETGADDGALIITGGTAAALIALGLVLAASKRRKALIK